MPYAADGLISRDPIDGGIEISEQEYQRALAGMQAGEHVQIVDGQFVVGPLPEPEPEPEPDPSYKDALAELNAQYQVDIDALSRAYGTAALAGGANVGVKQAAINAQYNERKTQYAADYAALRAQYGV